MIYKLFYIYKNININSTQLIKYNRLYKIFKLKQIIVKINHSYHANGFKTI